MSILNDKEIPVGLGMALAQNLDAMKIFSSMSDSDRQQVITKAQNASSKEEMFGIVSQISQNKTF